MNLTPNPNLSEWIQRLSESRVLVLGDVMLDRFVYGEIDRISPEAPVPVLRSESSEIVLGGAGNVVRNLVSLGVRTGFVGLVGEDETGQVIRALLSDLEISDYDLVVEPERQSTVKTRFIAERQQVLRVDEETVVPIAPRSQERVADALLKRLPDCSVVVLSDYGKGFFTESLLQNIFRSCLGQAVPVLVDPIGIDYSRYKGATVLTPNLKELGAATGLPTGDSQAVVAAAEKLLESCRVSAVLATRGSEGMSLVESNGRITHLKALAREVFDVSGAGDTVISVLSAAISLGAPLPEAAELANLAAGIVVARLGTAVVQPKDLMQAFQSGSCVPGQ